jgi:hypothetical protein
MNPSDLFWTVAGLILIVIEFVWDHRGVVAVVLVLITLVDIARSVGAAATALWEIDRVLDGERRARDRPESDRYLG